MRLLIEIPDEQYEYIKKSDKNTFAAVASKECMLHAIKNGIPYEERPQGEWKVNNYGDVYCSNCGIMALCKEFMADDFREVKTDYCAFCGADMRGEKDE